ncbi:MAG: FAD-dependent oxidoreductase [Phycisphaerales bacterium]|nr:FAD-dependent oxidoreductase [Phycisphaerales bacterium]
MRLYKYLIIGAGMTAAAAIAGIREVDNAGAIGLIGAEAHPPYDRPPLSKGLWKDKPQSSIWRSLDKTALTLHLGRTVRTLNPEKKSVVDDQGGIYTYDKLLLATGGTPRRLPFGEDHIIYFRTLDDYTKLRELTRNGNHFAVIGAGFIGSEIAAALAMNGKKVTLIFPDKAIGSRMYPPELAEFLNDFYREKGITLLTESKVSGCDMQHGKLAVKVSRGSNSNERQISVDGVIAGIGVEPNVSLAAVAGLKIDNGIRVDASLRTSSPDIYAAGDAASFYSPALDTWLRVEHEDNANTMGGFAGVAMAGRTVAYSHLPFFYSDLFDMGYEAVGEVDSRLEMLLDWKVPLKQGVVYYRKAGRVRGVLLWNIFGQVDAARALIAAPGPLTAADLVGRISP